MKAVMSHILSAKVIIVHPSTAGISPKHVMFQITTPVFFSKSRPPFVFLQISIKY